MGVTPGSTRTGREVRCAVHAAASGEVPDAVLSEGLDSSCLVRFWVVSIGFFSFVSNLTESVHIISRKTIGFPLSVGHMGDLYVV